MGRPIILVAIVAVAWLLYKLYFQKLLQQGKAGKIKICLIVIGLVLLGMAMSGKAHALFAVIGAAMTQIMRISPLLIRFAPSLRRFLGTGALGASAAKASGAGVSRVVTDTITMTLQHASGQMDGEVLKGPYQGNLLSQLSIDKLKSLYLQCQQDDPDAVRLLISYLQKERSSEWQFDSSENQKNTGDHQNNHSNSGMSISEASEILGVSQNATKSEVVDAHRSLMGRLHPDKGGNNYLAAKVNAAKKILLENIS